MPRDPDRHHLDRDPEWHPRGGRARPSSRREAHGAGVPAKGAALGSTSLVVLIVTYVSVVFGELTPKRLGQMRPEAVARIVSPRRERRPNGSPGGSRSSTWTAPGSTRSWRSRESPEGRWLAQDSEGGGGLVLESRDTNPASAFELRTGPAAIAAPGDRPDPSTSCSSSPSPGRTS